MKREYFIEQFKVLNERDKCKRERHGEEEKADRR